MTINFPEPFVLDEATINKDEPVYASFGLTGERAEELLGAQTLFAHSQALLTGNTLMNDFANFLTYLNEKPLTAGELLFLAYTGFSLFTTAYELAVAGGINGQT